MLLSRSLDHRSPQRPSNSQVLGMILEFLVSHDFASKVFFFPLGVFSQTSAIQHLVPIKLKWQAFLYVICCEKNSRSFSRSFQPHVNEGMSLDGGEVLPDPLALPILKWLSGFSGSSFHLLTTTTPNPHPTPNRLRSSRSNNVNQDNLPNLRSLTLNTSAKCFSREGDIPTGSRDQSMDIFGMLGSQAHSLHMPLSAAPHRIST